MKSIFACGILVLGMVAIVQARLAEDAEPARMTFVTTIDEIDVTPVVRGHGTLLVTSAVVPRGETEEVRLVCPTVVLQSGGTWIQTLSRVASVRLDSSDAIGVGANLSLPSAIPNEAAAAFDPATKKVSVKVKPVQGKTWDDVAEGKDVEFTVTATIE